MDPEPTDARLGDAFGVDLLAEADADELVALETEAVLEHLHLVLEDAERAEPGIVLELEAHSLLRRRYDGAVEDGRDDILVELAAHPPGQHPEVAGVDAHRAEAGSGDLDRVGNARRHVVGVDQQGCPDAQCVDLRTEGRLFVWSRRGGVQHRERMRTGAQRRDAVAAVGFEVGRAGKAGDIGRAGRTASFRIAPRIEHAGTHAAADGGLAGRITAPLPGLVSKVEVAVGQDVVAGEPLIILEAMKLMYSLPAQISGRVTQLFCAAGDTVTAGAPLIDIE